MHIIGGLKSSATDITDCPNVNNDTLLQELCWLHLCLLCLSWYYADAFCSKAGDSCT